MTADDLLREASDPTTSGERLKDLWRHHGHEGEFWWLIENAVVGNPAFPLWPLRGILLKDNPRQLQRCAWFNPVVPVLLMKEPLPEYRARATRLLYEEFQSIGLEGLLPRWPVTLDQLVALSLQQSASERAQPLRHLAHRLASLFALPWPEAT